MYRKYKEIYLCILLNNTKLLENWAGLVGLVQTVERFHHKKLLIYIYSPVLLRQQKYLIISFKEITLYCFEMMCHILCIQFILMTVF